MKNNQILMSARLLIGASLVSVFTGCALSDHKTFVDNETPPVALATAPLQSQSKLEPALESPDSLTLEKIMANPDWIGNAPQSAYWGMGSNQIFFLKKQEGTEVRELWSIRPGVDSDAQLVDLEHMHQFSHSAAVYNLERTQAAWLYANNIFVQQLDSGLVKQLSKDNEARTNLSFLLDGRIAYQVDDAVYAVDPHSGMTELLVSWHYADKPSANKKPQDFLAKEQLALISTLRDVRNNRKANFKYKAKLNQVNASVPREPFYLPKGHNTVKASISPNTKWLVLSVQQDSQTRSDDDVMPNYVTEDGRIFNRQVRQRVSDAKQSNQILWLLNLQTGEQQKLSYYNLPGYNEDVLASVKRENHAVHGLEYKNNPLPREIGLIRGGLGGRNAIQWHSDGSQVAIMLEAWDNKDRWIATVDFQKLSLVSHHRLHDPAWINYRFNSFGWLNKQHTLYYLSEQSGYSHIYVKPLSGAEQRLTQGNYEIDNVTLTSGDGYLYFQANQVHPGIYEIYRLDLASGEQSRLTQLNGMSRYVLSPDEQKLLITHSKLASPAELFVLSADGNGVAEQLTNSTTEEFEQIQWVVPQVVAIPSSHQSQPIYARLYLPKDYQSQQNKAVVFNHGAGYLQNAHLGWSVYFREFMFHSLLVQHGYVVLDMDYRASQGYGRDWRTAIYRQMGTPEVEDLVDGVNWLVESANVDRQRVGTYGGSYGGFLTFMSMFNQPDLFQAGAALRPVSDWAHYNTNYTSNILNTPDLDPIAYRRSSPIYFAEGLQKPLLINAPMLDSNVFFQDVVRLVQRLIELEKQDFETAIYPLEGHGFKHPSSWLDEYRRIFKLFEENL